LSLARSEDDHETGTVNHHLETPVGSNVYEEEGFELEESDEDCKNGSSADESTPLDPGATIRCSTCVATSHRESGEESDSGGDEAMFVGDDDDDEYGGDGWDDLPERRVSFDTEVNRREITPDRKTRAELFYSAHEVAHFQVWLILHLSILKTGHIVNV
jgi:hypothetical protein